MQTSGTSMHTAEGKRARADTRTHRLNTHTHTTHTNTHTHKIHTHNNKVSDETIIIIKEPVTNYPPNRPQIDTENLERATFKVCKSVHHRTIQINHQPDTTVFQFIILTFIYSSCSGRFPAHHQQLYADHEHSTTITTIRR
jgi:hypothetical protein